MKKTVHSLAGAAFLVLSALYVNGQPIAPSGKAKKIVSNDLLAIKSPTSSFRPLGGKLIQTTGALVTNGMVVIDAVATDADGQQLLDNLTKLGLKNGSYYQKMVSGLFPVNKIDQLEKVAGAKQIRPAYTPQKSVGAVTSQAYFAMKADVAKANYGVTGKGSKIGILSDSYDALGGAADGVASGDLPADVQVLEDLPAFQGSDEGRAMAELVHDVAPGAKLAFHTAFTGQAGFANGILKLANRGCNIIVDDIFYYAEPFFQDGIIAQMVNNVAGKDVSYFSSAGNHANISYEAKYKSSGTTIPGWGVAHDFGGGDTRQTFTIAPFGSFQVILQWDDPFYSVSGGAGAKTDIDLLVYYGGVVQFASFENNLGGDPVEGVFLTNNSPEPAEVEIAIAKFAGPDPKYVKWIHFGNGDVPGAIEYNAKGSTVVGHANALGALAVGASPYFSAPAYNPGGTPTPEYFTSLGGTPVFITNTGVNTGFAEWKRRLKPQVTAPDGTNTTFFGFDIEGDGFNNFFGTSAAAPHAAAVAALMQEGNKSRLKPVAVASVMALSAIDMDNPNTPTFDKGFDLLTGWGLIQADKCVQLTRPAGSSLQAAPPPPLISSVDATQKAALDAYPNPSKGLITVSSLAGKSAGPTQITITNTLGQQVVSFTASQGMMQKQINLAKYGRGLYVIKLVADGETVTKKIVIE